MFDNLKLKLKQVKAAISGEEYELTLGDYIADITEDTTDRGLLGRLEDLAARVQNMENRGRAKKLAVLLIERIDKATGEDLLKDWNADENCIDPKSDLYMDLQSFVMAYARTKALITGTRQPFSLQILDAFCKGKGIPWVKFCDITNPACIENDKEIFINC